MAEEKVLTPKFDEVVAHGPHGLVRVSYADWGPADAAQVVICVHGLTRNCRDFDFLARRLAAKGMRIVAPDLPGRGKSAWVENASDYATPLYLCAVTTVISRTGAAEVDYLGTSLGGHIGMELAALDGAPIRRLILNDFGARISGGALQRILRNVELFLACDRIHGDLSAYNILYQDGEIAIIDFAQALDPRYNPEVYPLLARDVERVCRHFARYGVEADAHAIASDLWARYLSGDL